MKHLVLVVALIACGKTEQAPAPSGTGSMSAGSGPAAAGSGPAAAGSGSAAAGSGSAASSADPCKQPCLLLRDTALAAVRTQCPDWAVDKEGQAGCDEADFARNCIYASYGYAFKKDRWKKAFGALPWYKPVPDFKESALSSTAVANVAELQQRAAACRPKAGGPISAGTRAAVEAWFARRAKGVPPLPDKVTDLDGKPIDKAEFAKQFLGKDSQLFKKDAWEPIERVGKRGAAEVVRVGTGVPDPSKCTRGGEECEGFESITFIVTDGKITAIEAAASACPFVYVQTRDGWSYRGEVLRNLATPATEATSTLELGPSSCARARTIRITEEKRERTYLDSVALAIDGAILRPDACSADPTAAVCSDDGRYLELATGDAIEVAFTLPSPSCSPGALVANGYYVPLP